VISLARIRARLAGLSPAARAFLLGSAWMGAARAVPQVLLPLYLDSIGCDKQVVGDVLAAEAPGQVLVALPAALILSRRSTPPVLVLGSVATGACYMLLPWLPSTGAMWACNLVGGFAWWLHMLAVAPFLYRHAQPAERALVFGLAEAVHTLAAVAGGVLGGWSVHWLEELFARTPSQALGLALSAAGALCWLSIPFYARIRDPRPPSTTSAGLWRLAWSQRRRIGAFALPRFVLGCGAGLCIPFLGLYFHERFGFEPEGVSTLQACGSLLMSGGYLVAPLLLHRFGYVRTIVGLEFLSIPFFLLLAWTTRPDVAVLAFLMRGALMNSATPVHKSFTLLNAAEGLRELQNAVEAMAWGLGWYAGPSIGGRILDLGGDRYAELMLVTVAFYLAAIATTWWLLARLDPTLRKPHTVS
jgi:predicted MFS family arabinose efflux permease